MALIKCITYSITLNDIVNHSYMVESANLPIGNLDPDLKVYAYHIPFEEPVYDERLFQMVTTRTRKETPHPDYPELLTYEETYSPLSHVNEDLINSVVNTENINNEQVLSLGKVTKTFAKAIGLTYMAASGDTLTSNQLTFMNSFITKAIKFIQNGNNAQEMIDNINASEPFDIDQGWEV